ncbi:hypothetical protein ACIRP3_03480 [Streptomyces sp. NPDC101209]|uniref:hypothetical protein n=1 Tax=Streptomyces sp. NPDC101209 TaxID=3366129 RepID=UPI00381AE321
MAFIPPETDHADNSDPNVNPNDYGAHDDDGSTTSGGDHHYHGGTGVLHDPGVLTDPHPFVPPPVPGGDGHNGTSVSTPSMNLFAANIDLLIQPVRDAATALSNVAVAPGAFYHANKMRATVNGANADGGLKKSYGDALSALIRGLTDLRDGVQALSRKYGTTEEANRMTAGDLADAFTTTTADFNTMMTSNGGSAMTPTGSGNTTHSGTNTTTA